MKWDSSSRPIRQSDESRSRFALSCSFDFVPNTHLTISPSYRRLLAPEISPLLRLVVHTFGSHRGPFDKLIISDGPW